MDHRLVCGRKRQMAGGVLVLPQGAGLRDESIPLPAGLQAAAGRTAARREGMAAGLAARRGGYATPRWVSEGTDALVPMLDEAVARILEAARGRAHIFNLGHGISKETPIAHVERMIARVRRGARG